MGYFYNTVTGRYILIAISIFTTIVGSILIYFAVADFNLLKPTAQTYIFTPQELTIAETEIVNPYRGLYKWIGKEIAPLPEPARDIYSRYTWDILEPEKDKYDFSLIDKDIQREATQGRKFSFRIRAMRGYNDPAIYVPKYMQNYGWWADTNKDGKVDTFMPDWNNEYFLERSRKLLMELGKKYNNDPRVGWIDVGIYGQYGEWYVSPNVNYKTSKGFNPITLQNQKRVIDMHAEAFPDKQLLVFLLYPNFDSIKYAFEKDTKYPIGWRVDCLGRDNFFGLWDRYPDKWNQIKDQWKKAPSFVEFCYINAGTNGFKIALEQTQKYHVSAIGNGNTDEWAKFSQQERSDFLEVAKATGYRLYLTELQILTPLKLDSSAKIQTKWLNRGVAPIYEQWNVNLLLKDKKTHAIVFKATLNDNLPKILPSPTPEQFESAINIPSSLNPGQYDAYVIVEDKTNYRLPLSLAIKGKQGDGSYYLGTIQVN